MFGKNKTEGQQLDKDLFTDTPSPVRQAMIAICEKCGKKLSGADEENNPARKLQKTLKEEFKNAFGKGEVRAVISSCLDICPKDQIAIGIFGAPALNLEDRRETRFVTVSEKNVDRVPAALLEFFKP